MTSRIVNRYALAAALVLTPGALVFAQESDTFEVSATVEDSCVISAENLDFGTVNVLSGTDVEGTTSVTVTCTNGATYEIGLNEGSNGIDVASRELSDGTGSLAYALYSDAERNTNWGNTQTTDTVDDTGTGEAQVHTVYGRIPAGQTEVASGTYTDIVTATVYY